MKKYKTLLLSPYKRNKIYVFNFEIKSRINYYAYYSEESAPLFQDEWVKQNNAVSHEIRYDSTCIKYLATYDVIKGHHDLKLKDDTEISWRLSELREIEST